MRVLRVYHGGRDTTHRERDRALVRAGVELTLAVPQRWPGAGGSGVLPAEPFELVELALRRVGDVNRHTLADPAVLAALVDRVRPDVVDLHEEPVSAVVHQALGVLPRSLPVVAYTAQNLDKRFPPPFAQWERRALGGVAGLYPCSAQAASVAVGKGFTGVARVLGLPPAPEIGRGDQAPPSTGLELRLLLVGRLVPEKGVLDAVRVLAALHADGPTRLTVVGEGPEDGPARALAAELGVAGALELLPWAGPDELARHYAGAHVLLAPSRSTRTWVEQFGRMLVEAHAAGAVVAGYASGSVPEGVGDAGLLVAEGDHVALAAAVAGLRAEPSRWTALRERGLERATHLTWDAVAAGQADLYQAAQATGAGRRRVRPGREQAQRRFGPPAEADGVARPFALPLLRDRVPGTALLERVLDAAARR